MAKVILKVKIPSVSRDQDFNLEVEANSKGQLSLTLPQQTVTATNCFLPFSEIVEKYPVQKVKNTLNIPNLGNGQAIAKTVTGRKIKIYFSSDEMRNALLLALTADYC